MQIDAILGEITIGGRRRKLRGITSGLSDAYTATLERIRRQRGALGRYGILALMWISLAERPLLVDELCHALAVEVEPPNINLQMVPPIETVVASCMGLITIDHASQTVRLVHATLKEYLCSHRDSVFWDPHATIAEVCLSYLSIQSVRKVLSNLHTVPDGFPLLGYASCHWGAHAGKEPTVHARQLALGILDHIQYVVANISLSPEDDMWRLKRDNSGLSGLHYVAYFGISEILEKLLDMGQGDLNKKDWFCRTPLHLAAGRGNERVVKTLLRCTNINPNAQNLHGETPLHRASITGYEGVVRTLLNYTKIHPDLIDGTGYTPLFRASANGHEGVVRALLSRADVNPNITSMFGHKALSLAAENGYARVVSIILSHTDNNPNLDNWDRRTALSRAAGNGHKRVVKIIQSHINANPGLDH